MPRMMVLEKAALIPKIAGRRTALAERARDRERPQGEDRKRTEEVGEDQAPFRLRRQLGAGQRAHEHDRNGEVEREQG